MTTDQSLAAYYAQRANEYERIYAKPERQSDLCALRELVAQFFAGEHVLEVACGTGYWTKVLSNTAASVLAMDLTPEVLDIARSKRMGTNVSFLQADAHSLPETPSRFSAGFSGFWWSHITRSRLAQFLRGFHQRLQPAGKVLFIDNRFVEGSSTPISRIDTEGNSYQVRRLENGTTHEVIKNFPDESELRRSAEQYATRIEVQILKYYWILSYEIRSE